MYLLANHEISYINRCVEDKIVAAGLGICGDYAEIDRRPPFCVTIKVKTGEDSAFVISPDDTRSYSDGNNKGYYWMHGKPSG